MPIDRREFLLFATGCALAHESFAASADVTPASPFKAIVFDAFPIFDPRPVSGLAESLFPGKGSALMTAWHNRQFEYQWLRALSGRYIDFLQVTEESLRFAANQMQLELSADQLQQLMSKWNNLEVWPDVPEALKSLHNAGFRLAFLSNMTAAAVANGLKKARLEKMIETVLSTDQIHSYKPDPHAYQMAAAGLQLPREEILFVAFAGWDVAGAKWFGYTTFWVNRLGSLREELGVEADAVGRDLNDLLRFLQDKNS